MSAPYGHKTYQNEALASLRTYLRRCQETNDPGRAFREVTGQLWGQASDYRAVTNLPEGVTMPADMPFLCLRVPTGGGKTVIGARCVRVVRDELLETDHPLVLWLVPSEAIRAQTLRQMRSRKNPLRQVLDEELGRVEVMDLSEAMYAPRPVLDGSPVILVSTIQSFRTANTEGRKVYDDNGSLMSHFDHVPDEAKARLPHGFPHSLANVLRLRRPLVIMDEAHNARTKESMVMLERFQPRAVIELTATPRTEATATHSPSNVLHSASADALKAERMIKLPIIVDCQTGWKELLGSALAMRESLETKASAERATGAPLLRPIMLIQAEAHSQQRETLHWEIVEKALKEDFHIPAEQIAVAANERRDLADEDVMTAESKVRFIITQQALKEGWDCSWAYVLCSLAETYSSTGAVQILGRILRQPDAQERATPELNQCYAFLRSSHFIVAAEPLREHLTTDWGFEEREASSFVAPLHAEQGTLPLGVGGVVSIPVTLAEDFKMEELPATARAHVQWVPETRLLTISGVPDSNAEKALLRCVTTPETQTQIQQVVKALRRETNSRIMKSPADRGERFVIPRLMIYEQGRLVFPDESQFLSRPWELPHPIEPADVPALIGLRQPHSVGILDVEDGRVITRQMPELQREMEQLLVHENWTQNRLITWLDRNIRHPDLPAEESSVWLYGIIRTLQEKRGHQLGELIRDRFILRRALEQRLDSLRRVAERSHFQELLFGAEAINRLRVGAEHSFEFDRYAYPARWICPRGSEFQKHYYEKVGELKGEGEEFLCARFLDSLKPVSFWVRNLERQPQFSFWLQTSSDRFYPDFICRLHDGRIGVVEYKNATDWSNDDNKEKRDLGALWSERSGGTCLFFMPRGPDELAQIAELFATPASRSSDGEELFEPPEGTDRLGSVASIPTTSRRSGRRAPLEELSVVRVLRDFRAMGVHAGETGTIVHVYEDGGYEVEFTKGRAHPAIVTVEDADVEALVSK